MTVTSWFAGSPCDAWVLRLQTLDAVNYAMAWLSQEHAGHPIPDASLSRWMQHLADLDISSVGAGLVVMSRPRSRKPWIEVREAPSLNGMAGASIARVLAARELVAQLESDDTFTQRARVAGAIIPTKCGVILLPG